MEIVKNNLKGSKEVKADANSIRSSNKKVTVLNYDENLKPAILGDPMELALVASQKESSKIEGAFTIDVNSLKDSFLEKRKELIERKADFKKAGFSSQFWSIQRKQSIPIFFTTTNKSENEKVLNKAIDFLTNQKNADDSFLEERKDDKNASDDFERVAMPVRFINIVFISDENEALKLNDALTDANFNFDKVKKETSLKRPRGFKSVLLGFEKIETAITFILNEKLNLKKTTTTLNSVTRKKAAVNSLDELI